MASEPSQPPTEPPARDKVRLRFQKAGDLRLVSHHDLMKVFERMCRRAALPVLKTKGFHPKPRIVFPLSLALGVVGLDEPVEIELEGRHEPEEIRGALARQAPPGLNILSAHRIAPRAGGQARRVCYRAPLPPSCLPTLSERINSFLGAPEYWVERARPQPRRVDLRPLIRGLRPAGDSLELDLWVTPGGMARPEEILAALGLSEALDGAVLQRTLVELIDETTTPGPTPQSGADPGTSAEDADGDDTPGHVPLLPGPLSFDS